MESNKDQVETDRKASKTKKWNGKHQKTPRSSRNGSESTKDQETDWISPENTKIK
jgi:hypothetical protein